MDELVGNFSEPSEIVDCLCIGTSILMSFEACYQAGLGKKVMMVDRDATFGGAWKTIEISGIKNVENAIHYFTPNDRGIKFLREDLKWPIESSKRKYRYFKFDSIGYLKFSYDSVVGKLIDSIFFSVRTPGFASAVTHLFKCVYKVCNQPRGRSYYVSDGAAGIISRVKALLSRYQIDVRFNSNINKIFFDLENSIVHCHIGDRYVICKTLIFGHGARIPAIESTCGFFLLDEKLHSRPAFHLVVEDDVEEGSLEIILTGDSLIKYVHDVSRFSSIGNQANDKRKVFVFALHSHVTNSKELSGCLFRKLKDIGVIGKEAKVTASLYSDIILPTLYDEHLYMLKGVMGELVNVLRTDNFSNGVGYYADRWKS